MSLLKNRRCLYLLIIAAVVTAAYLCNMHAVWIVTVVVFIPFVMGDMLQYTLNSNCCDETEE